MPFFTIPAIPFTVKVAIAAGTAVAIMKNKETILEKSIILFESATEFCKRQLEESKIKNGEVKFADDLKDHEFSNNNHEEEKSYGKSTSSNLRDGDSDFENISTPDTTDFSEIDTDYEPNDYDDDDEGFDHKQNQKDNDSDSETVAFNSDVASLD
ncbi:hypothetical protein KGF54_003635 [Candida jiufengensis]|uniref:uncharacterized protein n=1 Tax=Candida jiufengensis TaxID=497108 RepID=UPI0022251332|nr:uncharacterized protein KGF54_003635 [Candida jiufengensis]KAI5952768.1 hypothetical protein KGF54_003635 [Candida jiufengensis]